MFECLVNESQGNFGSVCWHDKVSIVEKGLPDLENATESLAYKSRLSAKSLPLKNVFLSFPFETRLVFLSSILRSVYSAFSLF